MKTLELNQMEELTAGDFVGGLCGGIGAASVVYAIGAYTQWWNPVGWVSIAFIAADAACVGYGISQA